MQNVGISFMIILLNFSSPESVSRYFCFKIFYDRIIENSIVIGLCDSSNSRHFISNSVIYSLFYNKLVLFWINFIYLQSSIMDTSSNKNNY